MWKQTYSTVTNEVSKEQLWKLFSNVNQWHAWDKGIEYASMEGDFEKGNFFTLKPKGGPKVKIRLVDVVRNKQFTDCTTFPLAKMYGEHIFAEIPEGLRITTTMKVEGPLGFLWRKLVAQGIADALPEETKEQIRYAKTL
jgi:hypothetical protein